MIISLTTLNRKEFEELSEFLELWWARYNKRYTLEGKLRERSSTVRSNTVLKTSDDRLLFILYHLKCNPIQEIIGISFEMTQAQVSLWIKLLSGLLREALFKQGFLPKRKVEELKKVLEKKTVVLLDATERRVQRPVDNDVQRDYFSGKKTLILSKTMC